MRIRTIPLRTGLIFTILLMGIISIILVLASKELYSNHAIESHHNAFHEIIRIKTEDLLAQLGRNAGRLGLEIQHDPAFRSAFRKRDKDAMEALMNDRFNQYYVTANILGLRHIDAWDGQFRPLVVASDDNNVNPVDADCATPADLAARRSGAARLKPVISLCSAGGEPFLSVAVPIGLRPEGYINVVTDPAHDLRQLEPSLGHPLQISLPDGTVLFQSENWNDAAIESLIIGYPVAADNGRTLLQAAIRFDNREFANKLVKTRNNFMLIAGVVTILTIMLAYLLTELIIVQPLQEITSRLKYPHLYPAENRDAAFISEFAELKDLYTLLENQSSYDRLTGLASRVELEKHITALMAEDADPEQQHAVCYIDLDRFKEIIDHYGHVAGEELLKQVTQQLRDSIRPEDIAARVDGDEFAILMKDCTLDTIRSTIEKFNSGIDSLQFIWNGKRLSITVSTGIVRFSRDTDITNVLGTAHTACYLAKDNPDSNNYFYRASEDDSEGSEKIH